MLPIDAPDPVKALAEAAISPHAVSLPRARNGGHLFLRYGAMTVVGRNVRVRVRRRVVLVGVRMRLGDARFVRVRWWGRARAGAVLERLVGVEVACLARSRPAIANASSARREIRADGRSPARHRRQPPRTGCGRGLPAGRAQGPLRTE